MILYPGEKIHVIHRQLFVNDARRHKRLTYRSQGRDFRITDVKGNVITKIIA